MVIGRVLQGAMEVAEEPQNKVRCSSLGYLKVSDLTSEETSYYVLRVGPVATGRATLGSLLRDKSLRQIM